MERLNLPLRHFFATPLAPCPYLPGRMERKIITLLGCEEADEIHNALSQAGFRRSQDLVYRPACDGCNACIPVRIDVRRFSPSRTQRRIWKRNADLTFGICPPIAEEEHYALFRRYLLSRHASGGMAGMNFTDYRAMVEDTPISSHIATSRHPDRGLVAACLVDRMQDGFSLVYSFFEPSLSRRSLGTYVILSQIERTRALGLDYLYLGYWVPESPKMAYKIRFSALEKLTEAGWRPVGKS